MMKIKMTEKLLIPNHIKVKKSFCKVINIFRRIYNEVKSYDEDLSTRIYNLLPKRTQTFFPFILHTNTYTHTHKPHLA